MPGLNIFDLSDDQMRARENPEIKRRPEVTLLPVKSVVRFLLIFMNKGLCLKEKKESKGLV